MGVNQAAAPQSSSILIRLHLVENHVRLTEILRRVQTEAGSCHDLLPVKHAAEVSDKDDQWFNGPGSYLISPCYLTACLFASVSRLREQGPYLRLAGADDTRLLTLLVKVSLGFLEDGGIYYATQPSIGQDLRLDDGGALSYRQFCKLLQDPSSRVWMDRLLTFYLDVGHGQKLEAAITAIGELSDFLDTAVAGGASIRGRLEVEQIRLV